MMCDLKYKKGTVTNQEGQWESTSRLRECHIQRPWGRREWFWKKATERGKEEHMSGGRMCLEQAGLCWPLKALIYPEGLWRGFYGAGRQLSVKPCYNMKLLQIEVMLTVTFLALAGDVNKLRRLYLVSELNLLSLLKDVSSFLKNISLFIWLHQVLAVAWRV